ncbi:MAG: hypothetical protein M3336_11960 [Chloroflexota bacterium]|nr:hypothetical protein [Chloroflexota bacterium]
MTPAQAFAAVLAEGHRMLDLVMSDVTPEMAAWSPATRSATPARSPR